MSPADDEVINLRAQLRREQDARAELRIELDRVKGELATAAELLAQFRAKVNAQTFKHASTDRRLYQVTQERDQARRELVAAMQTIENASLALGGVREQREQPGELEEWPAGEPARYNGSGTPCDMWTGPCQCGATHTEGK